MKRLAVTLSAACAAVALTTACGEPAYHYVKNTEHEVYFKVPREWPKVDQRELDAAEAQAAGATTPEGKQALRRLVWAVAYDDAKQPTVLRIFGSEPLEGPVAYAQVRLLPELEEGAVTLDDLRDVYLAVTPAAREAAAERGTPMPGFQLLVDEEIKPGKGMRGVHVRYTYTIDGQPQTFDLTSVVHDKAKTAYKFVVQCTASCFAERQQEIDAVVDSFTVRKRT